MELSQDYIDQLKALAKRSAGWVDDEEFMVDDYAGGNIDDAYQLGEQHGATQLAREILDTLGVDWNA